MNKVKRIADTVHGNIEISQIEKNIISQHVFNRLHNIMQNSTTYLTYPSNETKRFEHSLGVMHLSGEIFYNGIAAADENVRTSFFKKVKKEVLKLNENEEFGYRLRERFKDDVDYLTESFEKNPIPEPLYKKKTPVVVQEKFKNYYYLLFQSVRCAALLHDLGHPPFSHVTEFALNDVLKEIKKVNDENRTSRQKEFIAILEKFQKKDKLDLHEGIGNSIANRLLESVTREINVNEDKSIELFYLYVHKFTINILKDENEFFKDVHAIVNSPLDSDRLDYVTRDLKNSGFRKGVIEYDRLISSMKLVTHDNRYYFLPSTRVLSSIEDFYERYVFLYKYVLFHHRVIKTDRLLREVLYRLSLDYLQSEEAEKGVGLALPLNISGLWKPVKQVNSDAKYFNLITQWDDSWLFTVLRQIYYEQYQESEDVIRYQLEEVLSNKKYYHSVIKRMDDFLVIEENFLRHFSFNWESINEPEAYVKPLKTQYDLFQKDDPEWKLKVSYYGFFLAGLKKLFIAWQKTDDNYKQIITESILLACKGYGINEQSVLIDFTELKTGLEKDKPLLHNKGTVIQISELSRIEHESYKSKDVFPQFFLYLQLKGEKINVDELLADVGKMIGIKMSDYFNERGLEQ